MKTALLALMAAILFTLAIISMLASASLAIEDSPWAIFYALVAIPAVVGGRILFWVLERTDAQ